MLWMVLRRKRVPRRYSDFVAAASTAINPRVWGCLARIVNRVELRAAVFVQMLLIFV